MSSSTNLDDTVDLGDIVRSLRRGILWIIGGAVLGVALALAAVWALPSKYEATATVLVRGSSGAASALSQIAGLEEVVPGLPGLGGMGSSLDTEIEILTSRAVIGEVVDSLRLQAKVEEPEGVAATRLFAELRTESELGEAATYRFQRAGDVYRVESPRGTAEVRPGVPQRLGGVAVTLHSEGLPDEFEVTLLDREAAIDEVVRELEAAETAGEVVELEFRAADGLTASRVPNLMVEKYLERRRTVDRGTNQHRYEFLLEHADSISTELASAEAELRAAQERSGMLDPELSGQVGMERAMDVQALLETAGVEARALQQVLTQLSSRNGSARELAAYPTFLQNPAINALLEQLLEMDTERTLLLQRRTEEDPEVVALTQGIAHLESQLVSLARDYLRGLERQQAELAAEMEGYTGLLQQFPQQAMENLRNQREVRRLSETLMALQAQLVTARLAAITEGGEVRQIDAATTPRQASFPSLPLFLAVGLMGGLALGTVGALGNEYFGSKVRFATHAEIATGLPALVLRPGMPLLLGGLEEGRSVLVVPVGEGARAGLVAQAMARTTALRGTKVALVDVENAVGLLPPVSRSAALTAGSEQATGVAIVPLRESEEEAFPVVRAARGEELDPAEVRATLARLEDRLLTVVVAAAGIDSPLTTALLFGARPVVLVGRLGAVSRAELRDAAETLRRAGMTVSGVILHNGNDSGHPRA